MEERDQLFQRAFGMSEEAFYEKMRKDGITVAAATGMSVSEYDFAKWIKECLYNALEKALKEGDEERKEAILVLIKTEVPQKAPIKGVSVR